MRSRPAMREQRRRAPRGRFGLERLAVAQVAHREPRQRGQRPQPAREAQRPRSGSEDAAPAAPRDVGQARITARLRHLRVIAAKQSRAGREQGLAARRRSRPRRAPRRTTPPSPRQCAPASPPLTPRGSSSAAAACKRGSGGGGLVSSRSSASRHHASRIAPSAGWVELATTSPSASSIANKASNAGRNSTGQ